MHRAVLTIAGPNIVRVTRAEDSRALWMTVLPLHAGDSFGAIGPVVLMVAALTLLALSLTGPLMWWQAQAARRRSSSRKQTA